MGEGASLKVEATSGTDALSAARSTAPVGLPTLGLACAFALGCAGDRDANSTAESPIWPLALEARIGSVDDPDLGLTDVDAAVFGSDGRLYIAEGGDREIRVFDRSGSLVASFGREGEGPGEFRAIRAIGFTRDTLWAVDGALRRVSWFTADGAFLSSLLWTSTVEGTPPPLTFSLAGPPEMLLDDGTGLLQQGYAYIAGASGHLDVPWLRLTRDGGQDTVAVQRVEVVDSEILNENGREFRFRRPITDEPIYHLAADGSGVIVIERPAATSGDPQLFRIHRISPTGDTASTRDYPYTPMATPADEAERQTDVYLARIRDPAQGPSREGVLRTMSQPDFLPRYLPPVSRLESGQDGWMWLRREAVTADSVTWDALDSEGEIRGSVRLAAGARIVAANDGRVAVLDLDELDVPFVSVYRVR